MGHVRDRWMTVGEHGRRVRNERWGKGQRWQARWVDAAGAEHARAFANRDAAEQYLARVSTGDVVIAQPVTFGEYAETWRRQQLHHRESTAEATEGMMRRMLYTSAIAHKRLGAVTRVDVQAAVVEWSQHYAPSTVRIAYSRIATVYKHAVADRLVQFSPCSRISLPNADHARIVPLTAEQVRTIAERVPAWYRSMVLVGAASGLRGGELRGLTVDRVSGDSIRVDRQLVGHNGKVPLFGPPKSEAGVRTVQVDEIAATELVAHLERWPAEDLIWRTRHHSPIDRQDASDVWREATRGMGLRPRSGFHDLRHFHASLLIAAGLSPRAVADRLGHADVAETLRTYSHLWPSDDARAVAATHSMMAAVIGPSVTVTVDPESEATPA